MATYYLDLEGGNDANDGLSFANRWKTFTAGATAARLAAGDTIRVMAAPEPTLVGNCGWVEDGVNVTLPASVSAVISDCESAWTGAALVTQTLDLSVPKYGSGCAKSVIGSTFTTGKVAHVATSGTLNLSNYQQVSFWLYCSTALAANTLSLRLCSDTGGVTTVNTIPIPAVSVSGNWIALTVDTGGALGSAIGSVALYADLDPGSQTIYLDQIIACKASSSADSLTLNSLIGKVDNLSWAPATVYAANSTRKPTQPNRNGYRYQLAGGGTSGASEPDWPAVIGATVTDNGLTWTCIGLEDSWWGIRAIAGTTVVLDNATGSNALTARGYDGATETVATYKREPIKQALLATTTSVNNAATKAGTVDNFITYSGGWSRTDMSVMDGETWISAQNGQGIGFSIAAMNFIALNNLNAVRANHGFYCNSIHTRLTNCHASNCSIGLRNLTAGSQLVVQGGSFRASGSYGVYGLDAGRGSGLLRAVTVSSTTNNSGISDFAYWELRLIDVVCKSNSNYALNPYGATWYGYNVITANNGVNTAGIGALSASGFAREHFFQNCQLGNGIAAPTAYSNVRIYSNNDGQTAGSHVITTDGGTIRTVTDVRQGSSGVAWRFNPTNASRSAAYPLWLSLAKIALSGSAPVTLRLMTRRDSVNIKGQLLVRGGQIKGVPDDISVACEPAINSWVASADLTITPQEAGVVEVLFLVGDGIDLTNSFWIDSLVIS